MQRERERGGEFDFNDTSDVYSIYPNKKEKCPNEGQKYWRSGKLTSL